MLDLDIATANWLYDCIQAGHLAMCIYSYTVSLLSDSIYNIIGCDNLIVTLNLKLAIKMMLLIYGLLQFNLS